MDARDLALNHRTQVDAQLVDRAHRDLRHFELDAVPREFRERRRCASERDVQQLDQRVGLADRQLLHATPRANASSTAVRMSFLSNGLLTNDRPPASCTSSCEEV